MTRALALCLLTMSFSLVALGCGDDDTGATDVSLDTCTDECTFGDRCEGETVVSCRLGASGCLVETRETCSGGCLEGSCVSSCDECPSASRSCDGTSLVVCDRDERDCLIETRTECGADGCDAAEGPAICLGAIDPCADVTRCDEPGATCAGSGEIVMCALDANGCLAETTMSCADGEACGGEPAACGGCADTCEAELFCDGDARVTCEEDATGCLVEVERTLCAADCEDGACVGGSCPDVAANLSCGTRLTMTDSGRARIDSYSCDRRTFAASESVASFRNARDARVTVAVKSDGPNRDLFLLSGESGECSGETCLASSTSSDANERLTFDVRAGELFFLAYDRAGAGDAVELELEVLCVESTCGDETTEGREGCDDGNEVAGDGCDACVVEDGFQCSGSPSVCERTCGDGEVTGAEACDDGGLTPGDGCSATCTLEPGYVCEGAPSTCRRHCGGGTVDAFLETCDDGNTRAGDGCDDACQVEEGFSCVGEPSMCTRECGNGSVASTEECDDGARRSGDGCSATCETEEGFVCTGEPSVCSRPACDLDSETCLTPIPAPGESLFLVGNLTTADRQYDRRDRCGAGGAGPADHYYEQATLINRTGSTQRIELFGTWLGDGYLFAYDTSFDASSPAAMCIGFDDDEGTTEFSRIPSITMANRQRIVVVTSTWAGAAAIGEYSVRVTTE